MNFVIYRSREQNILEGCRLRDGRAQKELYESFAARMYSLCYRYVRDAMQAEDILVTAFMKVFDKIDQFKGDGSLEGWIRRIMVNECLSFLRKSRAMYVDNGLEIADQEPDYQQLSDALEAEDLLAMIRELPAGYRIVFNMYAIDGFSHKEIAAHLGITEATSKSQLCRARAMLQKTLLARENDLKHNISFDETSA